MSSEIFPTIVAMSEQIDSRSPATMGISQQGSRGTIVYDIDVGGATADELTNILFRLGQYVLGVRRLNRAVPSAGIWNHTIETYTPLIHPSLQSAHATQILGIQGVGPSTKWTTVPITDSWTDGVSVNGIRIQPSTTVYEKYLVEVEFASREFPMLNSSGMVKTDNKIFYDELGTIKNMYFANEWLRYTWYTTGLAGESNIVLPNGTMKLQQVGYPTTNIPYPGKTSFILPDTRISFRWYQVPWAYVSASGDKGSFIRGMVGRVNQKDWNGYKKGSLRYDGFTVMRRYPQPVMFTHATVPLPLDVGTDVDPVGFNDLCDLEFTFIHTNRQNEITDGFEPLNGNFVAAGHNLLPSAKDRKFYYGYTDIADGMKQRPSFLSAPFELLFTNPLAANDNWPAIRA